MNARVLAPLALLVASGAASATVVNQAITEAEVLAAQKAWCQALVDISAANDKGGQKAAKELAEKVIDAAYGYQMGAVLFKPTLTVAPQTFRTTREGALAYFVGGDSKFPKDTGFALKGWTKLDQVRVQERGHLHRRRLRLHHGQRHDHRQGRQGHHGRQDLEVREGRRRQAAHRAAPFFAAVQHVIGRLVKMAR